MTDVFDKEKRSWIMSRIRSKGTKPEALLFEIVKELHHMGYRYVKHSSKVFGKPDLAFPKYKLAVFVDGEFWHGKGYSAWGKRLPKKYWQQKILRNIRRDRRVSYELKKSGWSVIRVWGKTLEKKPEHCFRRILKKLFELDTSDMD